LGAGDLCTTEWRREQEAVESNGILLPSTLSREASNEEFIGQKSEDCPVDAAELEMRL
jgi:hypothetical protein